MAVRMNYWSRVIIPSTFSDAAAAFDQMVVDTFCQRMKLSSLSDVALSQYDCPSDWVGLVCPSCRWSLLLLGIALSLMLLG